MIKTSWSTNINSCIITVINFKRKIIEKIRTLLRNFIHIFYSESSLTVVMVTVRLLS